MTSDLPATSPLGAIVSLLPLILSSSSSSSALPDSVLSTNVLLRHKYLEPSPSSSNYLQATSSVISAAEVERRREALSTRWLEDIRLSNVEYSGQTDEDGRLVAKLTLAEDDNDAALDLLVVWEEATLASRPNAKFQRIQAGSMATSGAPRTSTGHIYADEGYDTLRSSDGSHAEEDESAWRYYDIQLPNEFARGWYDDPADAIRARDCLEAVKGMTGIARQKSRASSHNSAAMSVERATLLRESRHNRDRGLSVARPMHVEPPVQGLQGEEGAEQDVNDYWAGCESDDENIYQTQPGRTAQLDENVEDDYWASYDQQETTIPDHHAEEGNVDAAASDKNSSRGDEMFGEQSIASPPSPPEYAQDITMTGLAISEYHDLPSCSALKQTGNMQRLASASPQHDIPSRALHANPSDAATQRAIRAIFDMFSASQPPKADEEHVKERFLSICHAALRSH